MPASIISRACFREEQLFAIADQVRRRSRGFGHRGFRRPRWNRPGRLAPAENLDDALGRVRGHVHHGVARVRRGVRRQDDIVEAQKRMVRGGRFVREDIQAGARDHSFPQRLDEFRFVHHLGARAIDQVRRRLHQPEFSHPDDSPGLRVERQIQRNEVRRGE